MCGCMHSTLLVSALLLRQYLQSPAHHIPASNNTSIHSSRSLPLSRSALTLMTASATSLRAAAVRHALGSHVICTNGIIVNLSSELRLREDDDGASVDPNNPTINKSNTRRMCRGKEKDRGLGSKARKPNANRLFAGLQSHSRIPKPMTAMSNKNTTYDGSAHSGHFKSQDM